MKIYFEIRSGTGGKDADNFAEELLEMYFKYAFRNNVSVTMVSNEKTKIVLFEGKPHPIGLLLKEAGVHKVQRVPKTERKEKMQTSTATVAAFEYKMPAKIDDIERDVEFQAYRDSGPGGQHRNKTDSAIRAIHKPTGLTVTCANERSQYQNKAVALETLAARLEALQKAEHVKSVTTTRQSQILNAERSESKRTYNYSRGKVVDYQTGVSASVEDIVKKAKIELFYPQNGHNNK